MLEDALKSVKTAEEKASDRLKDADESGRNPEKSR